MDLLLKHMHAHVYLLTCSSQCMHVCINCRRERVSHLVYPLCTVLDDSIGCALWFAARGEGVLYHDSPTSSPDVCYRSQARVNSV